MNKGIFNGKFKALTFSFDDGNLDDRILVKILNKYGLKCTFNLSSGLLTENVPWNYKGIKEVKRINYCDYDGIYRGHEIAAHSYTHPDLTKLAHPDIVNQIALDKKLLEFLFDCKIEGFAYPMGAYNNEIGEVLKENGIKYARTTKVTHDFSLPEDPIFWHSTCKFSDERVEELARKFIELEDENAIFYIWGHSYEMVDDKDIERFENLCKILSGRDDIAYMTNIEVINALNEK